MLPGKKYKPEDYLWLLWTRKWFIVVPTVLVSISTFVWSWNLPDRYKTATTILIVPQRVPETYVRSTVTATVAERLQTITSSIMSRTRLERIIDEFKLYPAERQALIMEDVVELMRRDINVDQGRQRRREDTTSFTISYQSTNPRMAMQVADRLASLFVQENLQDREILADSTSQFLQSQLEDAKRRLQEHESKLEDFNQRNAGQLPAQQSSNLQMMQMAQQEIQRNEEARVRDENRLSTLQTAVAEASTGIDQPLGAGGIATPSGDPSKASAKTPTLAQQLETAKGALRDYERRFTPNHPDVINTRREIAILEQRVNEDLARQGGSVALAGTATPGGATAVSRLTQMRMEVDQLRKSIDSRKADDERLKRTLATYRARLEAAPGLSSELTELNRDYETIREQYNSLLKKSEDSKLAVNLERRQISEQFRLIDTARLPERPTSPNRLRLNMIGLFSGLGFGLALVALLHYRDTKLRTDEDVVTSLALPVIAVIPTMVTAVERERNKRRQLVLAVSTSVVVMLGVVAAIAWRLQLLRDWVR